MADKNIKYVYEVQLTYPKFGNGVIVEHVVADSRSQVASSYLDEDIILIRCIDSVKVL